MDQAPRFLSFPLAIGLSLLFASSASAHAIQVFAWVGGAKGGIQGEVFAPGAGPIVGASIDAYDADDKLVASSQSDDEGEFSLEVEAVAGLRIVATTDDGHRDEYVMPSADHDHADADHDHDADDHDHAATEGHDHAHGEGSLEAEVDALVHQVIEMRRELAEMRSQVGIRDIAGGVGFILGLTGIWFFMLGRRRRE